MSTIDEWMNKLYPIHIIEYYTIIKKDEDKLYMLWNHLKDRIKRKAKDRTVFIVNCLLLKKSGDVG